MEKSRKHFVRQMISSNKKQKIIKLWKCTTINIHMSLLGFILEFLFLCHSCSSFSEFLFVHTIKINPVLLEASKLSYKLSTQKHYFQRIITWCAQKYFIFSYDSHMLKENLINSKMFTFGVVFRGHFEI